MARTTPAVELEVGERTVRVSNPDKIYFAERGLTKLDVVQYFLSVGTGILGALRDRPTTLERWPSGVFEGAKLSTRADNRGDAFYQKRVPQGAPDYVQTARITFPSGRTADEVCPTELAVVAYCANLGTLTFHPWPVRRASVGPARSTADRPGSAARDRLLRRGPGVRVRRGHCCSELGMEGHPKTSGGRGLHVYVPIEPRWTFVQARRAVIAFGRELERRMPEHVTMNWWKEERGRADLHRLQPDGQRPDDRLRLFRSGRTPGHRVGAAALGRGTGRDAERLRCDHHAGPIRRGGGSARRGQHRGLLDREDCSRCRSGTRRDHGQGDMPYPPEYPKMPGEPPGSSPAGRTPPTGTTARTARSAGLTVQRRRLAAQAKQ